jgi:predicted porin
VIATGVANADSAAAPAAPEDTSLTLHGITLYGVVDIGLQYETNGAPASDYFPAGTAGLLQKSSRESIVTAAPSNLGQSKVGLKGLEPLVGDWSGVFKAEIFFNPTSGDISDALKSVALNNGKALNQQSVGVDSSIAGQVFGGALYAGLSSPTYGTITFGRQNSLVADGVAKYDPMGASNAFSVIGFSGTAAGGGDTEDRRLDGSLKYDATFGPVHVGAQYQFNGASGSAGNATALSIGVGFDAGSLDAYYMKKNDAISVSALSATQVADLPALGYSEATSLSASISDNTTYSVMGSYRIDPVKIFAGYEHIQFANPTTPLTAGTTTIGGYTLAVVSNTAYPNDKVLQVYWAGVKFAFTPKLDMSVAYYGYKQNSYAAGADAGCTTNAHSQCSGTLNAASLVLDYRWTKRFDTYVGAMWSSVSDGLANGYLATDTIDPTIGVRYSF